jgi:hypothetical protein
MQQFRPIIRPAHQWFDDPLAPTETTRFLPFSSVAWSSAGYAFCQFSARIH